jgi:hypothetical protein
LKYEGFLSQFSWWKLKPWIKILSTMCRCNRYFQEFIGSGDAKNVKHLIKQQAEWAKSSNDPRAAA